MHWSQNMKRNNGNKQANKTHKPNTQANKRTNKQTNSAESTQQVPAFHDCQRIIAQNHV